MKECWQIILYEPQHVMTHKYLMHVLSHNQGDFKSLRNANILIYWPHGFGDCVFLSYILPFLNQTNKYWIVCNYDDETAVFDNCQFIEPIYTGSSSPQHEFAAAFRDMHFGFDHTSIDGRLKEIDLPTSLYNCCRQNSINILFWTSFPEQYGTTGFPYHTKARALLSRMVDDERLTELELARPLKNSLSWNVSPWLQKFVQSRLENVMGMNSKRKLCLITRNGFSSFEKNWGHRWREEMPEGKRREGEECRDFMRLLHKKDSKWVFLIMEERMYEGDDTVRSSSYNAFSYAEVFGSSGNTTVPFAMAMKVLVNSASLSVAIPTGPLHLSMLRAELPTIGLWLTHYPSWYDEPKAAAVHIIGQFIYEQEMDKRPGSFDSKEGIVIRTRRAPSHIITAEQVIETVETLLY